jgi:hypothetical protein
MRKMYDYYDFPTPTSIQFDNYTTHIIFANENNSFDTESQSDIENDNNNNNDNKTYPNNTNNTDLTESNPNNNHSKNGTKDFSQKERYTIQKKYKKISNLCVDIDCRVDVVKKIKENQCIRKQNMEFSFKLNKNK